MSFLVGPVNSLGHPFPNLHEVPIERRVGRHTVYAFGKKWLYSDLKIVPAEPIEAVVVWDPGWLCDGAHPEYLRDEIAVLRERTQEWDVALFGLASDWFATWGAGRGMHGMLGAFRALDGVVIDPVGAAALRATMPRGAPEDPADYRHRAIVEVPNFLHAGRLPNIGRGEGGPVPLPEERTVDVCMVSNLYPNLVVFRPYFTEAARRICDRHGWSFVYRNRVRPEEMEELYLDSKVVLNMSLGSQPNCRVYEALACGAALVTDGWNLGMEGVPCERFGNEQQLEVALSRALNAPDWKALHTQTLGLEWAWRHTPETQWAKVLDAVQVAAAPTAPARAARMAWEKEMDEKAKSAPMTNDGRRVILV